MAIKRMGTNKYKIIVEAGFNDFGKRMRKTKIITGTRAEAKEQEIELKHKVNHKDEDPDMTFKKDITFKEYSKRYIEIYCKNNIGMSTIYNYKRLINNINSYIGGMKLRQIESEHLDALYGKLKIGQNGQELSYYSQYDYYKLLKAMFRRAVQWKRIKSNPHDGVAFVPNGKKNEQKVYDEDQVRELVRVLDNECIKYKTLIMLALDTGARRSEIVGLKWNDLNLDKQEICINRALKVVEGIVDEDDTKSDSSKRRFYFSETTKKILLEYQEWQNNEIKRLGNKWHDEGRVFTSKNGSNMNPGTCWSIFNKIQKKYGLEHIKFHDIRRTNITMLINSGVNPKTVSDRVGHSDTKITMSIYTKTLDSAKKECADRVNEILIS